MDVKTHRRPPNEELWDDIFDKSLFTDEDGPSFKFAWDMAQTLIDGRHLTKLDLIALEGLLTAAVDHGRYLEKEGLLG